MIRPSMASLVAVTCATFALAGCTTAQGDATSTLPSASSGPIGAVSPAPTPAPSPTPSIQALADGGTMFPGTYRTQFNPSMTITITDLVDLDCAPGYRCRGDIDLNSPVWVEFEFGNVHGSDLVVMSLGKLLASDGKTLIDPPDDLVAWMLDRAGMHENTPRQPVTIGGVRGTRIDITSDVDVNWGPTNLPGADVPCCFGINGGAGARVRFNVLHVNGHWVLIEESLGPENTVHNFDAVVTGLQPVVDSITWN